MDDPVRQRGFAVVDMGDNGKIADVLHRDQEGLSASVVVGKATY
jgi:hypothetical protein